jgi:hypothetical protein
MLLGTFSNNPALKSKRLDNYACNMRKLPNLKTGLSWSLAFLINLFFYAFALKALFTCNNKYS